MWYVEMRSDILAPNLFGLTHGTSKKCLKCRCVVLSRLLQGMQSPVRAVIACASLPLVWNPFPHVQSDMGHNLHGLKRTGQQFYSIASSYPSLQTVLPGVFCSCRIYGKRMQINFVFFYVLFRFRVITGLNYHVLCVWDVDLKIESSTQ